MIYKWCPLPTTKIWVNIGSDDGLLPDGIKPLSEPKVFSGIQVGAISQEVDKFPNWISLYCADKNSAKT